MAFVACDRELVCVLQIMCTSDVPRATRTNSLFSLRVAVSHIKTHKTWEGTLIQAGVGDGGSGAPASGAEGSFDDAI